MYRTTLHTSVVLFLAALSPVSVAQEPGAAIERARAEDATLDCAAIQTQQKSMAEIVAAGDPSASGSAKAAAGTAANVGGQVAGAAVAQSSGLFGGFGGLISKVAGGLAQQQAEQSVGPDVAAQQRAATAKVRGEFLASLANARECRADDPSFAGKPIAAEEFQKLVDGPPVVPLKPLLLAEVQSALAEPVKVLDAAPELQGDMKLAGKEIYISEYRVLFEVGGKVSASTRAGYMPGTNYGATRSTIKYQVPDPDIAVFQAITDKAWADFKERIAASGVKLQDADTFVSQHGAVYAATEPASQPGAPVYLEENLGHSERKFLVMSPTGMKTHSRGFAGWGAGDLGKRMEFSKAKRDGIAIGIALNIAALESSGSGSSILNRQGASTNAGEGMSIAMVSRQYPALGHVDASGLTMPKALPVPGTFASFKETGGFNSQDSSVNRALQIFGALGGVAANKSKIVEMDVILDGPSTTRMALSGLATFNKALAEKFKAGM